MLVTIITPSFNQGEFIEQTIESVVGQTYEHIEYIIIDACSTDNTGEVLHRYKSHPRVTKIICEKDKGQTDAINKGFRMAKGSIVGWINSDDYLPRNIVKHSVSEFERSNKIGLTYGNIIFVDKQNKKIREVRPHRHLSKKYFLNKNYNVCQPGSFYRKGLVEKKGYLDESLFYSMDLDLWLKILDGSNAKYLDETAGYFRWYPETKTSTGGCGFLNEILRTLNKHGARTLPATKRKIYWYTLKTIIKELITK